MTMDLRHTKSAARNVSVPETQRAAYQHPQLVLLSTDGTAGGEANPEQEYTALPGQVVS